MSDRTVRGWRCAVSSLTLLALGACGFQLQGRQTLPAVLTSVHIDAADQHSDFTRALQISLQASGARLVERGAPDAAEVRIVSDAITERVLSVDARNIPTDFELIYDVEIQASAQGRELLPAEKFSQSRIYSFDETRLLAKDREKEVLKEALARDMASVVTRRLSALQ